MLSRSDFKRFARRLGISFFIALTFGVVISEVAFLFQKDRVARPPQTIELVIPAGTAAEVAAGKPVPSIPEAMDFLIGDTLQVVNQDEVDHQLGPVWVPPGTSASLRLEQADKFAYACSFKPTRYLGVNVRQPTTLSTRLTGLGLVVPPTTMVLLVYSLLLYPLKGKENESTPPETPGTTAPTPLDGEI